jgi:hypothetical protein
MMLGCTYSKALLSETYKKAGATLFELPAEPARKVARHAVPKLDALDLKVVDELLEIIDSVGGSRMIFFEYFANISGWLPIIFKPRMHYRVRDKEHGPNAEFCVLVLSMHLVMMGIDADVSSPASLYHTVKSLAALTGAAGSLDAVQARILLAVFEMGRGLLSAAQQSLKDAASLAMSLGMDKIIDRPLEKEDGRDQAEEVKRAWWAILILER